MDLSDGRGLQYNSLLAAELSINRGIEDHLFPAELAACASSFGKGAQ